MSTVAELKARILSELQRPSLTAQCAKAVTDAIEFYAMRSFWFNTVLDETITTAAGDPDYTIPPYFRAHKLAEITIGGERTCLRYGMEWDEYRHLQGASSPPNGQPTEILYFGDLLYLYPTPADAYPLSLTYCSALPPLVNDGDSNAWTTSAEPLIRARAKWDLLHNVIRDYPEAERAEAAEGRWYGLLQARDMGRRGPARIVAASW